MKNLAAVLAVTPESIEADLESPKYSVYEPVPIAKKATRETVTYILEHPELFPGVKAQRQSIREYRERLNNGDPVASHLLGYVASINKQEYKIRKGEDYTPNDLIGKQGIEQLFESELKGKPRERRLEVDSRGRLVGQASVQEPTPGNDVELTIDLDLQRVAENSLNDGMIAARRFRDADTGNFLEANGGAVIVLDAQNGDIVALASAPTFDIGKFTTGIPAEDYQRLVDPASNYPLINPWCRASTPRGRRSSRSPRTPGCTTTSTRPTGRCSTRPSPSTTRVSLRSAAAGPRRRSGRTCVVRPTASWISTGP